MYKRQVYLFELDSVRNSKKEIQRGQQALFEEIVKKGNTVVLSFNQLTDSEAFLCAIRDEKAYEQMVQLFALGAIKISRYGDVRTPSQYIQNAIDKCNDSSKEEFLFSGLPVQMCIRDSSNGVYVDILNLMPRIQNQIRSLAAVSYTHLRDSSMAFQDSAADFLR